MPEMMVKEDSGRGWKVLGALTFVGVLAVNIVTVTLLQKGNEDRASASAQREAAARNDCRTYLATARNDVRVGQVTFDKAAADHAFYEWLTAAIAQDPATATLLDEFKTADRKLGATITQAAKVPSLEELVQHGGDIGGAHYAACGKVG